MSKLDIIQDGYEIRVIAPSSSLSRAEKRSLALAESRLNSLGYTVSFGDAVDNVLYLGAASMQDRLKDFHTAYSDKNVRAVMALTGGWLANELLALIDWRLIIENPKPFIGYSDNTVLVNAIYAMTGRPSLLGPNFHTLTKSTSWQYTLASLDRMLRQDGLTRQKQSVLQNRGRRVSPAAKPWVVLRPGVAEARLIGGNLGSFYLLQGTPYQPRLDRPFILAVEDDDESGELTSKEFSRRLESILQLSGARDNLKGLLIGRFQPASRVREVDLAAIISTKRLGDIPIVTNIDFGHTLPMLTLPIGGIVQLEANEAEPRITIQNQS